MATCLSTAEERKCLRAVKNIATDYMWNRIIVDPEGLTITLQLTRRRRVLQFLPTTWNRKETLRTVGLSINQMLPRVYV